MSNELTIVRGLTVDKLKSLMLSPSADVKANLDARQLMRIAERNPSLELADLIDFIHTCQREGADPFREPKPIYLIPFKDKHSGKTRGNAIYSYHFFMSKANGHKDFMSCNAVTGVGEYFCTKTKKIIKTVYADCTVKKKNGSETIVRCWMPEFNKNQGQWNTMPYFMLEKCSKANALRQAFPNELGNIKVDNDIEAIDPKDVDLTDYSGETIDATPKKESSQNDSKPIQEDINKDIKETIEKPEPQKEQAMATEKEDFGAYVCNVGKYKSKRLCDIESSELQGYCVFMTEKVPDMEGQLLEFINAARQYLVQVGGAK